MLNRRDFIISTLMLPSLKRYLEHIQSGGTPHFEDSFLRSESGEIGTWSESNDAGWLDIHSIRGRVSSMGVLTRSDDQATCLIRDSGGFEKPTMTFEARDLAMDFEFTGDAGELATLTTQAVAPIGSPLGETFERLQRQLYDAIESDFGVMVPPEKPKEPEPVDVSIARALLNGASTSDLSIIVPGEERKEFVYPTPRGDVRGWVDPYAPHPVLIDARKLRMTGLRPLRNRHEPPEVPFMHSRLFGRVQS